MFLKKEKDPATKLFDGDEWIRSLTEAQEITADIPEESVSKDQQAVDPTKVGDVDGFLECSLALGMVAAATRMHVAAQQAACTLPWVGIDDELEELRLQTEHARKMQKVQHFQ